MTTHYEILACGHQNNLLTKNKDGTTKQSGLCPVCLSSQNIKKEVKVSGST